MTNPEGFTPEIESICAEVCAEFGDPPCWRLPELVQPCEPIKPCKECLAELQKRNSTTHPEGRGDR